MAYVKGQPFKPQFFDNSGNLLSGGILEFEVWGTTTDTPVYSDSSGTSAGTSLTLNAYGKPSVDIFYDTSIIYKIIVKDSSGTVIDTIGPYQVSEILQGGVDTNWTDATDGPGTGLNADLLDSQEGTYYLDAANFTGNLAPERFAANSIDAEAKLASDSIDKAKMKANSVGTSQIEDLAVTGAKIADSTITAEKFAPGAFSGGNNALYTVGSGALGVKTYSVSESIYPGVYDYTNLTINSGIQVDNSGFSFGPLILRCTGTFTCNGTIKVLNNGTATWSKGVEVEGDCGGGGGAGGVGSSEDGNTGSGTYLSRGGPIVGGFSNNGGSIPNVAQFKSALFTQSIMRGGGYGGYGGAGTGARAGGGYGGGVLVIIADTIVFTGNELFDVSGQNGSAGISSNGGGGGGGGGGAVVILYNNATNIGNYTASSYDISGGTGGAGDGTGTAGGDGGDGYSYIAVL